MKVVQSCDEKKFTGTANDLPLGTVYKLKGQTITYLKVTTGHVDLTNNIYYGSSPTSVDLVYPSARIVLE